MLISSSVLVALLLQAAPQSSQPATVGTMYDGNNAQLSLPQEQARSSTPQPGQHNAPGTGGPAGNQNAGTTGGTVAQGRESATTNAGNPKSPPASGGGR